MRKDIIKNKLLAFDKEMIRTLAIRPTEGAAYSTESRGESGCDCCLATLIRLAR
jgi:hypothetical protein